MFTPSTLRRIADLFERVTGMVPESFVDDVGRWHYGWGFPGCLYEYQTNDGDDDGWDSVFLAEDACASDMLSVLRDYDRESLASALSR